MTKATLQLTTKIRFGSIFSTVIILHNRVRKNKTKLYGITKYASSENTMLSVNSDIQIFDVQIELYITFLLVIRSCGSHQVIPFCKITVMKRDEWQRFQFRALCQNKIRVAVILNSRESKSNRMSSMVHMKWLHNIDCCV